MEDSLDYIEALRKAIKNMEKEKITTKIGEPESFDSDYNDQPTPISHLLAILLKAADEGATHIKFSGYTWEGDCTSVSMTPLMVREETDKEYTDRIIIENKQRAIAKAKQEANDRSEYEKLKRKFEK